MNNMITTLNPRAATDRHLAQSLGTLSRFAQLPVALNDSAMMPIAYTHHDGPLDRSRREMLRGHRAPTSVIDSLDREQNLRVARDPRRVEPLVGLELGRVHVPVLSDEQRVVGHLWLIDPQARMRQPALHELQREAGRLLGARLRQSMRGEQPAQHHMLVGAEWSRVLRLHAGPSGSSMLVAGLVAALRRVVIVQQMTKVSNGDLIVQIIDPGVEGLSGQLIAALRAVPQTEGEPHGSREELGTASGKIVVAMSPLLGADDRPEDHADALAFMITSAMSSMGDGDSDSDAATTVHSHEAVTLVSDDGLFDLLDEMGAALPDLAGWTPPSVRRLLADHHGLLLARTAKTFLDDGGNVAKTSEHLGIHRGTLYYRLGRVEEIIGMRLDDGRHRLLLHLGLTMALSRTPTAVS